MQQQPADPFTTDSTPQRASPHNHSTQLGRRAGGTPGSSQVLFPLLCVGWGWERDMTKFSPGWEGHTLTPGGH